jgi:hypothetical protein
MRVSVELMDGAQAVRTANVLAGAVATPEDLYKLSSTADVEALRSKLEARAQPIAPGARARFLVTFYEFPQDSAELRVRVTADAARVHAASVER